MPKQQYPFSKLNPKGSTVKSTISKTKSTMVTLSRGEPLILLKYLLQTSWGTPILQVSFFF